METVFVEVGLLRLDWLIDDFQRMGMLEPHLEL